MDAIVVGIVVFVFTFAGATVGMWLQGVLPKPCFSADSKDTIKVGIGLISTLAALVLGLVTASSKSSFDHVDAAVKQFATQILTLDRTLARYGPETEEIRKTLKLVVESRIEAIWPADASTAFDLDPMRASKVEGLAGEIRALDPHDESQQEFRAQAMDISESVLAARWLIVSSNTPSIPKPFLTILVFWLCVTFVSYGLYAPRNVAVISVLFVCALSVSSAVYLVLEMDAPFDGVIRVSPEPLLAAHARLDQ